MPTSPIQAPAEFLADLRLVQESLALAGAPRQAFGELQHLIWQAETFGFHLAELEIRQHSAVHAAGARANSRGGGPRSAQTEEVLATLRVAAWIQDRFGTEACRRYVVSFTRSAADIAAVYELAAARDAGAAARPCSTWSRCSRAAMICATRPACSTRCSSCRRSGERLAANGRRLEVMLGYSDSAKELGPVSADAPAVRHAGSSWPAGRPRHDVRLTLFHGRGGALGRGGGPAGRAVLAQAPGSVDGRFKVTEQGEVVLARYGHLAIAQRHLEQVTSAVLLAETPPAAASGSRPRRKRFRRWPTGSARRRCAPTASWSRPPGSPTGSPGSARCRRSAACGSARGRPGAASRPRPGRPARDPVGVRLDPDPGEPARLVRAGQRPGRGGGGPGGLDLLRAAYREWPLLAVLLDNAEMSLAKTDRRSPRGTWRSAAGTT